MLHDKKWRLEASSLPEHQTFLKGLNYVENCPSRCTEMETSYSIELPAHKIIVRLPSNVTCLGSVCKAGHCACETRPQL